MAGGVMVALIGVWALVQIFGGQLSIGELIAFNSYLGFLLMPILTISRVMAQ